MLCQQNARDYIQYSTSYAICVPRVCHMTADTAQLRKRSNVTRPFPICGWGLGTRLRRHSLSTSTFQLTLTFSNKRRRRRTVKLCCACARPGERARANEHEHVPIKTHQTYKNAKKTRHTLCSAVNVNLLCYKHSETMCIQNQH